MIVVILTGLFVLYFNMSSRNRNPLISYENKWVALSPDGKEVIAWGTTPVSVSKKLDKMGNKTAQLLKVPRFDIHYSP